MRFELKVFDPTSKDLFAEGERSLQRLGRTKLIDETSSPLPRIDSTADGILTVIAANGMTTRYICEAKRSLHPNALAPVTERLRKWASVSQAKPLLIAPYVNDSVGERLRASEIAYLDGAGNAFLEDSSLYIWMRGFKPTERPERATRAFQATGLQLIALLLSQPKAVERPYRELAEDAGLSLGSVSRILSDLRSLGFVKLVAPGRNTVVNRRSLLEHWEFGYTTRLRARLKPQTYRQVDGLPVERLPERIPPAMKEAVLVGGELAAAIATRHLRPQTAAFHVRPHRPLLPIIKEMQLVPDRGGNIVLIEQFGEMSAWTWDKHENEGVIHPLLIYVELLHGKPDSRLVETAKLIFDEFLAPTLDNEP